MNEQSSSRPVLDFAIIGAQKSASTFVQVCLSEHPSVALPAEEARHFEEPWYSQGAESELCGLFAGSATGAVRGIKRPDYLARDGVPERLARHNPDLRLIVVLREPIARAVAAYYDYMRLGLLPLKPVEDGLQAIIDGSISGHPRASDILDYGLYARHLDRYLEVFPAERLLVLIQDDLMADPRAELAKVFGFLEVASDFDPPSIDRRSNRSVYSLSRLRVLRTRNRWMFDYSDDRSRRTAKRLRGLPWLWVAGVTAVDRHVLSRLIPATRPQIGPDVAARLGDFYSSDLARLEQLLSRDLGKWRAPSE
jgi:hypothetical protein